MKKALICILVLFIFVACTAPEVVEEGDAGMSESSLLDDTKNDKEDPEKGEEFDPVHQSDRGD